MSKKTGGALRYLLPLVLAIHLYATTLPLYFAGNKQLDTRELYEGIGLQLPYFYQFWREHPRVDPARVELYAKTLVAYYKSRGFYHARVRSRIDDDRIVLHIEEFTPVIVSDVTQLLTFDQELQMQVGERFDAADFVSDKKRIIAKAYDEGYCNADLDAKSWIDIETNQAYILYELDKGQKCRFGTIDVVTEGDVKPWLAESFLRFKEGEAFSLERIRQSYDMLYAQPGIARAVIETAEHNGSNVPVSLQVSVRENPIRLLGGIGLNSDEGVVAQGGIGHRNILGGLKTLSLEGRYSQIKQEIKSIFTMPLPDHNLLGASLGYKNEHFDGYKERSRYINPYVQQYDQPHSFKEGVLVDDAKTYDSSDKTLFPQSTLLVTSLQLSWKYDIRDKLLEPTKGYYLLASLQGSLYSPISEATYLKSLIGGARIFSHGTHVFAFKGQLGSIRKYEGELPSSYRFYAGGMNSNRAYSYRDLGPKNEHGDPVGFNALFEGSAEYRFGIYESLRGVLFSDVTFVGQEYLPDQSRAYVAVGTGLRYATPIGPFAIDIGVDVSDPTQYAIHFHIGELF